MAEITVRLLVAPGAMAAVVGAATLVAMEETVALAEVRRPFPNHYVILLQSLKKKIYNIKDAQDYYNHIVIRNMLKHVSPKIKPSLTMFSSGGFGGNFYSNDGYGGNYSHSGSVDWWGN